jgi:hypothetical protein
MPYEASGGGGGGAWTPDDVLAGVTNSFWTDPLAGTLFEDVSLETPATTGNPVGGVRNLSAIGTSTLSQSTTGNKFKVSSDGRIERDGTTTTQHLRFFTFSYTLSTGWCFAADIEIPSTAYAFGGDVNLPRISRLTSGLTVNMANAFVTNIVNIFSSVDRRRIIFTGNETDFIVNVDGVEYGPFSTGAARSSFSAIVLGLTNAAASQVGVIKYGRLLVAGKDLRANAAELDAWLGA